MAVGSFPSSTLDISQNDLSRVAVKRAESPAWWQLLRALGSLKITVAMFMAGIFILFVGTLAQDEKNLPQVKEEYFNSWIAIIPLSDFVPVTVFGQQNIPFSFPFLGGATIGFVLLINLIAAKVTRFHIAAKGSRLLWGTLVSIVGAALTITVIFTGHYADGLQGSPPVQYDTVWRLVQATSVGITVALVATAIASMKQRRLTQVVLWASAGSMLILSGLALFGGDNYRISDPGLRIMWQLMQSSVAGGVLLVGLVMVFGTRGGNVLIHIAVGLVMFGQFAFGDRQIEQRMSLIEGQTTNIAVKTDDIELAVIDASDPVNDKVTVVAGTMLQRVAKQKEMITAPELPFDIKVIELFPNSDFRNAGPVEPNLATTGIGKSFIAESLPPSGGVSSNVNVASGYVELFDKTSKNSLGTYLLSQFLNERRFFNSKAPSDVMDTIEVAGVPYKLQLRFHREYKPYEVTLTNVVRINYSASETPRDYSSYVTIKDKENGVAQDGRIWMNNPVRYKGETFYQSNYSVVELPNGEAAEMTGLQVVENAGWLIPYVSCVLAFWGMLAHFGGTFLRFADRYERMDLGKGLSQEASHTTKTTKKVDNKAPAKTETVAASRSWLQTVTIPLLAILFVGLLAASSARPRAPKPNEFNWAALGTIPVLHEGRIKPFDTVARNTLQYLSNRTTVQLPNPEASGFAKMMGRDKKSVPATQWLMGVISGDKWVDSAPVFRIDAKEVVDLFDLERHEGHRYSFAELEPNLGKLEERVRKLREVGKPADQMDFGEKKLVEINQKLMVYNLLRFSYQTPDLPSLGADTKQEEFFARIQQVMEISRQLESSNPPAIIPPQIAIDPTKTEADEKGDKAKWQALYPAIADALRDRIFAAAEGNRNSFEANPAILAFTDVMAMTDKSPRDFEKALSEYQKTIAKYPEVEKSQAKANFEAWLNAFNPTDLSKWLYVFGTVLCFTSFLIYPKQLNRFIFWMLIAVLILHTFALIGRVYITGRAPVINLYSSAVFIGWSCVLAGLAIEGLFRLGLGNLVGTITGAGSLMVAYGLDSGDTMHVLQAVLDTQFWLTTHVISVTLGYGGTFLAGFIALIAITHRIFKSYDNQPAASRPEADRYMQDQLYRMTYGVVCFALFFSFIGTVLGGLWADDSWGRFWGWDPKENGALMIVLWNAALLHARWDRLIGQRGFALFAIGGNIITAWSWFGTNQLGIGLHSYGFTNGVLMLLGGFVLFNLLYIAIGWVLTRSSATAEG